MIIKLIRDELWPLYTIEDDEQDYYDYEVEVSEELADRYRKVMKEFWEIQDILDVLYLREQRSLKP